MSMDFASAWSGSDIGDYLAVSDGRAMPSRPGGLPWRHWRSHNFVGQLVEKREGLARTMLFALAPSGAATVGYATSEATPHLFAASDEDAFAADVFVLS